MKTIEQAREATKTLFNYSGHTVPWSVASTAVDALEFLIAELAAIKGQEPVASFDEQRNLLLWTDYDKMKWPHGACQASAIPSWYTKLYLAAGAQAHPKEIPRA